ncbi:ABC transporter permease [Pontibacter oryzae]|uniref:ABC transporter permease subunit n=1 Tax=Pontibacter oryzae TaxID=2304593 RepID=A0A399SBH3_9BACT|nr:ABC transporter permease [Pontibacter oryzae]RIJ41406.1 ABC transporter permease subunit [Pontibacter oryzae]
MLLYLFRRILLVIPAFWALATLVFLLSRLLPGSFAEERVLQSDAGFYNKSDAASREAAYTAYLKKSGQTLPLFYISISPDNIPDTLSQIFPEARRQQLQQLAFKHGSWEDVAAYDEALERFINPLTPSIKSKVSSQLQVIRFSHEKTEIAGALTTIQKKIAELGAPQNYYNELTLAFNTLSKNSEPYSFLLPELRWNGLENQYHQWLSAIIKGDAGSSYRTSRPVSEMLWEAIANTFWLLFGSMLLTMALGLLLSIQMSRGKMAWLRRLSLPALFVLDSIPMFVLALLLLVLLANPNFLQLFPVYGMGYYQAPDLSYLQRTAQWLQFMALPITCLVLVNLPYITNQIYSALQAALHANYAQTARAKGLKEVAVIRRHALPNALLPIITLTSDFLPALVDGSIIIETVFAIPGTGRLLVESVLARDYPVLVAIVVLVLAVRMLAYALAEGGYAWADPRIKQELS